MRACCRQPSIAGLRVMISALHSSVLFGMPDTFMARSTYSSSCCLSTGFVRKPNAPLCVASTASGMVPCAVSSSTQSPGRWRWISFSSWMPSMLSMRRSRDDEIRPETRQRGERLGRAFDGFDVVVLRPQADAQQAQQARVVVDQQDAAAQRCSGSWLYLWIWTIFAFPNRSFDVGDGVESGACLVERGFELAVFLEGGLELLRAAIVALRRGRRIGALQAGRLGVEDQPLLDFLQVNQARERAPRAAMHRPSRAARSAAAALARGRSPDAPGSRARAPSMRRFVVVGAASAAAADVAEHVGLHDRVALDETPQRLQVDG